MQAFGYSGVSLGLTTLLLLSVVTNHDYCYSCCKYC
ncbi:putative signal peptide protein [Puccinia sorghi]|uniref:Putative signal peptide protein n=1 Tax=Puccinia sorghi TaxID=27349 RepID=A0A0L6U7W7_9BASI|nr:putative signal peptide protein [Puccinia sorghi]